jgi:hypothetical protein
LSSLTQHGGQFDDLPEFYQGKVAVARAGRDKSSDQGDYRQNDEWE